MDTSIVSISKHELNRYLLSLFGKTTFATVVAETDPRLKKRNNPFVENNRTVKKRSKVNAAIGNVSYERIMRKRTNNEEFQAQPRTWGERIPKTPFVIYKGKLYLEAFVNRVLSTQYLIDGIEANLDELSIIKELLPAKKTGEIVIIRDYSLDNIVEINFNKQHFVINK